MATVHVNPELYEEKPMKPAILISIATTMLVGCAFDITHVDQRPATFISNTVETEHFILSQNVTARLGTGFATRLKAGTRWQQVGSIDFGKVFATKDQIVTVEASDIYEADLVVSNQLITGFYLVVEKTFAPVTQPIPIAITVTNAQSTNSP
jgi:hypothetical protein